MTFLSKGDSIEKLNMSPRVNNALISAKIYTIDDLLSTSMEEISKIRNLGKKSLNEIEEVKSSISIGEKEERKKFMKYKGIYYIDPEIKDLGLSVRACNCLLNAKIKYFSNLRWKTRAQLESIENMGAKTLEEVLEKIKKVELVPAEKYLNNIRKENIANELSRKLNSSMDNLFGLLSYAMIRNLADSVANKALVPVIAQSPLNEKIGYNLVKDSIQLNEFGTIAVDLILKEYDDYNDKDNIFAAKLLRLLVLDHYYVYGSKDYKNRQKVWQKMKFGNKEKIIALQGEKK